MNDLQLEVNGAPTGYYVCPNGADRRISVASPSTSGGDLKELPLPELLQLCLTTGDEIFWTEFIRRSQPLLARTILKALGGTAFARNSSLIDDLVQDTYLKLCANNCKALRLFKCRHEGGLPGFLKVIARNIANDYIRNSRSAKRGSGQELLNFEDPAIFRTIADSNRISPETAILINQIEVFLVTRSQKCESERDNAIFWLYYRDGLCAKAISELPWIGLTVKGVESVLLRLTLEIKARVNSKDKVYLGVIRCNAN